MEERRLPGETESAWEVVPGTGRCGPTGSGLPLYLPDALLAFPGCRQVVRVEREVVHKGDGGGTARGELRPRQLGSRGGGREAAWGASAFPSGRWPGSVAAGYGTLSCHGQRSYLEDAPARCGAWGAQRSWRSSGPFCRLSLLRPQGGVRKKKAALETFSFHPLSALRFLGLYAV